MKFVIKIVLIVTILLLGYYLVEVIAEPIRFNKEKEKRYAQVIQRLKDIRTAQFAYKSVNQKYADSFDKLLNFIQKDSFMVIYSVGDIEDSLAVAAGQVIRDTTFMAVKDSLLGGTSYPFDSLQYVPFTNGSKFSLAAGEIEMSGLKVSVFEAVDTDPYDKYDVLRVGSLTEASTNGNWE
ncbi:MAG: hypothetical protein KDD36_11770 [Flavobacteriales bacterium]|nr:hypothetical protein [Flavobacteriales bacterium]